MPSFSTADLVKEIKEYQSKNSELLEKSHHFVFDCPFNFHNSCKPDYIWIGLNPGNDANDWVRTNGCNDEETRERDFQEIFGRSSKSRGRITKIKNFLGQNTFDKTTHTELFFWGSADITKDFYKRYGTKFHESPHLEFCNKLNRKLIIRVEPKLIFLEGKSEKSPSIDILSRVFSVKLKESIEVESRSLDIYFLDNQFELYHFDHLSARGEMINTNKKICGIVREKIKHKFGL